MCGKSLELYVTVIYFWRVMSSYNSINESIVKSYASDLLNILPIEEIDSIELAQHVLNAVIHPEQKETLPRFLKERVQNISTIYEQPGSLIAFGHVMVFRAEIIKKTQEMLQKLSKFVADYTELVNEHLDRFTITTVQEADELTESLKWIIDPEGNHHVADKFKEAIDDIKFFFDTPSSYAQTEVEQSRFIKIVENRIERRIQELSGSQEAKEAYIRVFS